MASVAEGDEVKIFQPNPLVGTVVAVSESWITVQTGIEDPTKVTIPLTPLVRVEKLRTREDILDAVADWIDTDVIADAIIDHLVDELGEELTLRGCKEVWLRELQGLLH